MGYIPLLHFSFSATCFLFSCLHLSSSRGHVCFIPSPVILPTIIIIIKSSEDLQKASERVGRQCVRFSERACAFFMMSDEVYIYTYTHPPSRVPEKYLDQPSERGRDKTVGRPAGQPAVTTHGCCLARGSGSGSRELGLGRESIIAKRGGLYVCIYVRRPERGLRARGVANKLAGLVTTRRTDGPGTNQVLLCSISSPLSLPPTSA